MATSRTRTINVSRGDGLPRLTVDIDMKCTHTEGESNVDAELVEII